MGLDKAKEAVSKERGLIRQKEQSGMGESNSDLAFLVHILLCPMFTINSCISLSVLSHI